jgi:hypothetical protein
MLPEKIAKLIGEFSLERESTINHFGHEFKFITR